MVKAKDSKKLSQMGFGSEKEAVQKTETQLRALQLFYQVTTPIGVEFMTKNKFPLTRNPIFTNAPASAVVGFDFMRGKNVKWNPEKKIFEAFDF